jgi:hypothetical protein
MHLEHGGPSSGLHCCPADRLIGFECDVRLEMPCSRLRAIHTLLYIVLFVMKGLLHALRKQPSLVFVSLH